MKRSDEARRGDAAAGFSPADRRVAPVDRPTEGEIDLIDAVEDLVNDLVPLGEQAGRDSMAG